jgi:lysozyme
MADRRAIALVLATAIAIPAEGIRRYAYYDPPGILTVCYGHTGGVVQGKRYSLEQCRSLLNADMLKAVDAVERCHPGLPENVLAAFADATYNIGPKVACDSTASKRLSQGRLAEACNELPKWDKSRVAGVLVALPGLAARREKERALCLDGDGVH